MLQSVESGWAEVQICYNVRIKTETVLMCLFMNQYDAVWFQYWPLIYFHIQHMILMLVAQDNCYTNDLSIQSLWCNHIPNHKKKTMLVGIFEQYAVLMLLELFWATVKNQSTQQRPLHLFKSQGICHMLLLSNSSQSHQTANSVLTQLWMSEKPTQIISHWSLVCICKNNIATIMFVIISSLLT